MGMFDSIYCLRKLPLNKELKTFKIKWSEVEFQTKNLENCLITYEITRSGHLVELAKEYEYIPFTEEELNSQAHKAWNIYKDIKEVSCKRQKVNYHGVIDFYSCQEFSDQEDIWVEFRAYFIYGKLDKIELKECKKSKSRSISNGEWAKKYEEEQKKTWSKIKSFLRKFGWMTFWRKVSGLLRIVSRLFSNLQSFILRHII
jgi:hypothetical protein